MQGSAKAYNYGNKKLINVVLSHQKITAVPRGTHI